MAAATDAQLVAAAVSPLIDWYRAHRRALPWRDAPTPYAVWVSEIMLQQTRIEAVFGYYRRFLDALPDIPALAAVEEDALLKLWEGLGYYSRARNLKKAAVLLMEHYGGELPRTAAELRKLPGIGDYTAGAIASIACGEPEPAVDGNVLRVVMRLLASSEDVLSPPTRRRVTELLRAVYPSGEAAALLTEGLMELGETVCIPNGEPVCALCPVRALCRAAASGTAADFPVRAKAKERRQERRTVLLLRCGGRYALRRRPESGLLAGLWEFPSFEGERRPEELEALLGLRFTSCVPCGEARHVFTHVEWSMCGLLADCEREAVGFTWATRDEIAGVYSIPTAYKAYKKLALQ